MHLLSINWGLSTINNIHIRGYELMILLYTGDRLMINDRMRHIIISVFVHRIFK